MAQNKLNKELKNLSTDPMPQVGPMQFSRPCTAMQQGGQLPALCHAVWVCAQCETPCAG
jgi:hypothetical protein